MGIFFSIISSTRYFSPQPVLPYALLTYQIILGKQVMLCWESSHQSPTHWTTVLLILTVPSLYLPRKYLT